MSVVFNLLLSNSQKSHIILLASAILSVLVQLLFAQTGKKNPFKRTSFALKDTTVAAQCFQKGKAFSKAAKFDSSNFYFGEAMHIYKNLSERHDLEDIRLRLVQCCNNIGINLRKQGKYENAMTELTMALQLGVEKLGENHSEVAITHNSLGLLLWNTGDYDRALDSYEKSLAIRLRAPDTDRDGLAKVYNNIGLVYGDKGDYDRALDYYQKSLSASIDALGKQHLQLASIYNNIGIIYKKKGDYARALEVYNKALSISVGSLGEEHPLVALIYNNIGNVYENMTDDAEALEYYQKSLSIRLHVLGAEHPRVADSYNNLGIVYRRQRKYAQALESYEKSLAIKLRLYGEEHPVVGTTYSNIGELIAETGEYERSAEYLQKALSIRLELLGSQHPDVAETYYNFAKVYALKDDLSEALKYCQKAITSLLSHFADESIYSNPPLEGIRREPSLLSSLKLKAELFLRLSAESGKKDLKMAFSTYQLASGLIDKMRTGYTEEGSKLFLGEHASEVYEQAIRTALKLYDITGDDHYKQQAFAFSEKSKAAVLQEGLAEAQARQFAKIPASLLEEEKQLRIDLAFCDTQLQKETLEESQRDSVKMNELASRLFDLRVQYERLIADFEKNYPAYYELKYQAATTTMRELQDHLQANTTLIEYFVGDRAIHIFTISKDDFNIASVDKDSTFSSLVDDFHQSLLKAETKAYLASASKLSELLIEPVFDKIKSSKRLVIIPHHLLYKIPFESLLIESTDISPKGERVDYRKLNYLVKTYAISYHYSATVYVNSLEEKSRLQAHGTRKRNSFVGFAPVFREDDSTGYTLAGKDLPILSPATGDWQRSLVVNDKRFSELKYSEHEVKTIIELFAQNTGDKTSIGYFYADATEDVFKKSIKNCRMIHIATHSFINEEHPQLSGVVFAQPTEPRASEDGVLYAEEAYNLDMSADLVVLSSCESGLGKLIRGEGMMALPRGFLYSGAANIIFSLWKVPDKHTSELMVQFYKQLLSGKSYAESLRQAKLRIIANPSTARPRSWASFVIIGAD